MSILFVRFGIIVACISIWPLPIHAQGTNLEYDKFTIGGATNLKEANDPYVGLARAPVKESTVAVSSIKSGPLFIFDYKTREVINEFDVGNWYAGSKINYSSKGKYIIIQRLKYVDFAPNKDREVNFEIIDASTGKMVKQFENYHSVKISPDEQYALALTGDEIAFWNLTSGEKEKHFTVTDATNSLDISPDGKKIAVSHKPIEDVIKAIPRYQSKDGKKMVKDIIKYKQMISVYDASTFDFLYTVNELYDIVYRLEYSPEGDYLFCQNIVHTKISTSQGMRQNFLNIINGITGEPLDFIIPSNAIYEPDFRLSPDKKLIGITSFGKYAELWIYELASRKMLARYELSYWLFQNFKQGEFPNDGRFSFLFLDDSKSILMTSGNRLVLWDIKFK